MRKGEKEDMERELKADIEKDEEKGKEMRKKRKKRLGYGRIEGQVGNTFYGQRCRGVSGEEGRMGWDGTEKCWWEGKGEVGMEG